MKRSITEKIAAQWPDAWINLIVLAWLYTNLLGTKSFLFGILCGITGFILGVLYFLGILPGMPEKRKFKWLAAILMFACVFNIFMPVL